MIDLSGQTLGQYEIVRLIGRGGMASVYLARQSSIGRMVALKILPANLLNDETFFKRFQREVKAVALMQHPRIIPVHDYGEEKGVPYIVMAYIDGGSLVQRIQEHGPLPLDETVRLVGQIGEGLDYAHRKGVIHRDFKPSNVLLDKDGNAYLSDFGIAKVSQETAVLTGSGIVGTPTYMAPEVFKQEVATPAVDIYALGVTLYQMLSGTTPFEGTTPVQLMYKHLNEPVPSIEAAREGVPPELQIVLDRAMAKNPADRYTTAAALVDDLRQAVEGGSLEMETLPVVSVPVTEPVSIPAPEPVPETMPPPAPTPPPMPTSAPLPPQPLVTTRDRRTARMDRDARKAHKGGLGCFWTIVVLVLILWAISRFAGGVTSLFHIQFPSGSVATQTVQAISQELGSADSLEVTLSLPFGTTRLESTHSDRYALEGEYTTNFGKQLDVSYELLGSTGMLNVTQPEGGDFQAPAPGGDFVEALTLKLTDGVPIDLTVKSGAGDTTLDLSGLTIQRLSVSGGLGAITIILPDQGDFEADVTAGVGQVIIEIPDSLEARVEFTGGLSDMTVENSRLTEISPDSGIWQTTDFGGASKRVRIKVQAGIGNVKVK